MSRPRSTRYIFAVLQIAAASIVVQLQASSSVAAGAFVAVVPTRRGSRWSSTRHPSGAFSSSTSATFLVGGKTKSGWSIADDWEALSREDPSGASSTTTTTDDLYNRDVVGRIAQRMDQEAYVQASKGIQPTEEDLWVEGQIDHIYDDDDDEQQQVEDSDEVATRIAGGASTTNAAGDDDFFDEDEMGTELSLLVRCNDRPEMLLLHEGRALPTLTDEEKYDASQLVVVDSEGNERATPFFSQAIETIFKMHASTTKKAAGSDDDKEQFVRVLDPVGVSNWLKQSLGKDETSRIGPHDGRVNSMISKYSAYGTGYVTLDGFIRLYVDAVVGNDRDVAPVTKKRVMAFNKREKKHRASTVRDVWRDLENHGIRSPAEVEREKLLKEMAEEAMGDGSLAGFVDAAGADHMVMDECEIVDEEYLVPAAKTHGRGRAKSSHEQVELADDGKTPLWMKDGQFVFIDEESCIGCTQCVLAAPASFTMNEYDGRARAFSQRNSPDVAAAVASCPVNCMHRVNYRELKELELARDNGDGRDDHRHFGMSSERGYINRIPLHVAGRDSDANHRSSWYHYLKNKCYKSKQCPQRGCYDCPMYKSNPQSNPHFQKRLEAATHIRAKHFIDHGEADMYRKTAEL